jgi:hypothetical protein
VISFTNPDESDRQRLEPDHYQDRNDIPHGPPGTVPNGLKLTKRGGELTVENLSNGTLKIQTWYTQKLPSGALLICQLVALRNERMPSWVAVVVFSPRASIKFTDEYSRLVSRGQCSQDLSLAKLEFIVRSQENQTYHFMSDTVFAPLAPPYSQWITRDWYFFDSLAYADKIDTVAELAKRELQIRKINKPWETVPLSVKHGQDQFALGDIAHAPAGEAPSWLKVTRQGKTVQLTNMHDVPIRLRLWFSLIRADGQSTRCELGTFKNNTAQLLSPTLTTSESVTFDRVFAHPLLLADCEQAFDQSQLELVVFNPAGRYLVPKYLFISDGAFSPSPPPNATSITFR